MNMAHVSIDTDRQLQRAAHQLPHAVYNWGRHVAVLDGYVDETQGLGGFEEAGSALGRVL